jgi:hypothetical protein
MPRVVKTDRATTLTRSGRAKRKREEPVIVMAEEPSAKRARTEEDGGVTAGSLQDADGDAESSEDEVGGLGRKLVCLTSFERDYTGAVMIEAARWTAPRRRRSAWRSKRQAGGVEHKKRGLANVLKGILCDSYRALGGGGGRVD